MSIKTLIRRNEKWNFDWLIFARCVSICGQKMKSKWCTYTIYIIHHLNYMRQWRTVNFVNHHHQTWWQENDWISYSTCLDLSNKPTFTFIDLVLVKWQPIEKIPPTPPRDRAKPTRQITTKRQTLNSFSNTGPIWKISIEYCLISYNWSINQLFVKSKQSTNNCTAVAIFITPKSKIFKILKFFG